MIEAAEIEAKAKEFEILPANVQRDYVFGWLLFGFFTVSELREELFLKGGNALRKGYFRETRFSSDLDFGIPGDISQERLLAEINRVCEFVQEKAGVTFAPTENKVEEKFAASETPIPGLRVYEARVYFKDFYGKADHIRLKVAMDVTRFDRTILPIQSCPLIHPYSDSSEVECNIRCMKLEEIVATKLKCLLQRQHAPDLFDYVYSIRLLGGELNRREVVDTFVEKTIFGRNPGTLKGILQNTPFDYFREFWDKTLICAKSVLFGVEEAIRLFVEDLENLFAPYPDTGAGQFVYFPAEVRGPIMKAGRSHTLLRIRYKGEERMVEPYSIKYLQKRQGEEREYFYVYNVSGGSNPPGIRSLVPSNLESVDNTEETFSPRFPIELSKAGETPENPYLFDPDRPLPVPKSARSLRSVRTTSTTRKSSRRSTSFGGLKFTYQCAFCGRKFTKRSQDSTLRPHKGKGGFRCSGTYGHYVGSRF